LTNNYGNKDKRYLPLPPPTKKEKKPQLPLPEKIDIKNQTREI
jgi:hypothetical protein